MFARSLKTTFTAGILASSLALTTMAPSTAQAGLSEDEIVGLLSLLVIGAAIHHSRNDDDNGSEATPRPYHDPRPRPQTQPHNTQHLLPAQCAIDVRTLRGGTVRMFMDRCLANNYRHMNRLPASCHINVRAARTGNHLRGYSAQCLRNAGFRTTRH